MKRHDGAAPRAGTRGRGCIDSGSVTILQRRDRACIGCGYPLRTPLHLCANCDAWSRLGHHIDGLQAALHQVRGR